MADHEDEYILDSHDDSPQMFDDDYDDEIDLENPVKEPDVLQYILNSFSSEGTK